MKTAPAKKPIVVEETKRLLTRELAGAIADALEISQEAYRVEIELDWNIHRYRVTAYSHMTDEQGQAIVKAIKEHKGKVTRGFIVQEKQNCPHCGCALGAEHYAHCITQSQ